MQARRERKRKTTGSHKKRLIGRLDKERRRRFLSFLGLLFVGSGKDAIVQ